MAFLTNVPYKSLIYIVLVPHVGSSKSKMMKLKWHGCHGEINMPCIMMGTRRPWEMKQPQRLGVNSVSILVLTCLSAFALTSSLQKAPCGGAGLTQSAQCMTFDLVLMSSSPMMDMEF